MRASFFRSPLCPRSFRSLVSYHFRLQGPFQALFGFPDKIAGFETSISFIHCNTTSGFSNPLEKIYSVTLCLGFSPQDYSFAGSFLEAFKKSEKIETETIQAVNSFPSPIHPSGTPVIGSKIMSFSSSNTVSTPFPAQIIFSSLKLY